MVNMKKHSKAASVAIKFELNAKELLIRYTDNGLGIPENLIFNNGLTNTGNRIQGMGGSIIFENAAASGLHIQLNLPVGNYYV